MTTIILYFLLLVNNFIIIMAKNVLITGGTGLVGTRLTQLLIEKGYSVSHLSRGKGKGNVKTYQWDLKNGNIEEEALLKANYIINLAGAGVFDNKWSRDFKNEILESRIESINLLYDKLKILKLIDDHKIKAFVSSSAIGFYGADTGNDVISESSPSGNDFLSGVVKEWEAAADRMNSLHIRTVIFRTGIVLSEHGGALEKIISPVKKGAGALLGTGQQYISWIHIDDLCEIFIKAIEDEKIRGIYNAVAPEPVTNEVLTKEIAKKLDKSILLPNVPAFVLKFLLGSEKAMVVLGGNKVSSEKIQASGYIFKFPDIRNTLQNLVN
jgi:uncharacterized protein (TIGR01777 family)